MPDRADPAGTVAAHLDAWNAPEGPVRDGAVGAVYTDDVFVGEPDVAHRGHEGMSRAIAALHVQVPGVVISRSGPIGTAQDLVTYLDPGRRRRARGRVRPRRAPAARRTGRRPVRAGGPGR